MSGLHEDAGFRNRVLGSALAVVLLVGAFGSGLEVSIRFGGSAPAALSPSGRTTPAGGAPTADGAATTPAGAPEAGRPPALPAPAPPRLEPEGPPLTLPRPSTSAAGDDGPRTSAVEPPGAPAAPPDTPAAFDDLFDGGDPTDDGRCIVTDTLLLVPIDDEALPGELCEDVTEAVDDVRAPDVDAPSAEAAHRSARISRTARAGDTQPGTTDRGDIDRGATVGTLRWLVLLVDTESWRRG